MNILVTGAAGFIGSHFARMLLDDGGPGREGDRVTALDVLTYAGTLNNLPLGHPRLDFVRGDIGDAALLDKVVPGHDAVVHFAAESHVDRSVEGAEAFVRTNVLGTQVLLDAALRHEVRVFVQVSTDEVYGSIAEGRWTEEEPLLPNSPYAASKASADLLARAYARTHGLDVRITRCANNYGPGQHPEKLIPRFATRLLDGLPVPLYGDGSNLREWLHVDDHCRAVRMVLERGRAGEVYNVGGGTTLSNREMTALLLELCGRDWDLVERVEDRKGHDFRYAVDDAKIRRELGYAPRRSLEAELAATVAWYASHRDHWEAGGALPPRPC
ncbi:dTDP-glucose 4,6-dehydratase [Streptomyces sp. NPDC002232]|uniref:dTDP-glucose 4,6-dehydratase n=1 Tax=Streptomyces sp. NPDC002232 TaxID=3364640 RepID=UPI0036803C50